VFKGTDDYEVVIEFDAWGADDVRGRRWHSSQELTECPNGMLRVRLRLNSLEEIAGWVLSFGTHATVVGPEELRRRLFSATQEVLRKYDGPILLAGPDKG